MRTDLITAKLIYGLLEEHAPQVAAAWAIEFSEQVASVASQVKKIVPGSDLVALAQHVLAKTVIESWDLKNVALIAAGTPTPLSPKPDQILYFTDANEEAVADAQKAGYKAIKVDATDSDDLKKLTTASTAVMTGLCHFLPDELVKQVFNGLATGGFDRAILTQLNSQTGQEGVEQYSKLGVNLFLRDKDEFGSLIPADWEITHHLPLREALNNHSEFGLIFDNLTVMLDVYEISKNGKNGSQ